ncbi:hypothetical protein IWW38_005398, partial [Coemansia aciculifera]
VGRLHRRDICVCRGRAPGRAREHVLVSARGPGVPRAGVWGVPVRVVQDSVCLWPARERGPVRVADPGRPGAAPPGDGDRGGVRGAAGAGAGGGGAVVRLVRGSCHAERRVAGGGAGRVHGGGVRAAQPGDQRAPVPATARHAAAVPGRRQPAAADGQRGRRLCAAQGADRAAHARPAHGQGRPVAGAGAHGGQGAGRVRQRRPGRAGRHGVVPARLPARQRRRRQRICGSVDLRHGVPGAAHGVRVQPQEAGGGDHGAPGVDERAGDGGVGAAAAAVPRPADGAHPRGGRHAVRARAGRRRAGAAVRGAVQHKVQADPAQHEAVPPARAAADGAVRRRDGAAEAAVARRRVGRGRRREPGQRDVRVDPRGPGPRVGVHRALRPAGVHVGRAAAARPRRGRAGRRRGRAAAAAQRGGQHGADARGDGRARLLPRPRGGGAGPRAPGHRAAGVDRPAPPAQHLPRAVL